MGFEELLKEGRIEAKKPDEKPEKKVASEFVPEAKDKDDFLDEIKESIGMDRNVTAEKQSIPIVKKKIKIKRRPKKNDFIDKKKMVVDKSVDDTKQERTIPLEVEEKKKGKIKQKVEGFVFDDKEKQQSLRKDKRKPPERPKDNFRNVMMLAVIGAFFLIYLYTSAPENQMLFNLIMIVGAMFFAPIGAVVGVIFLDPFQRCRMMRKAMKNRGNWGVIVFLGRGRKAVCKIKNFDDDLIWIREKCWVIKKDCIYEIDENGLEVGDETTEIDPSCFITMTETVPTMFIDIDNITPLKLGTGDDEGSEVKPEELGPALKGWVDNQQAKLSFLKKTMETYYLILVIASIGSAIISYQNNQQIVALEEQLTSLNNKLDQLMQPQNPNPAFQIIHSFRNFF